MPPILNDDFTSTSGTNLNDYNGWTVYNDDWEVVDDVVSVGNFFEASDGGSYNWVNRASHAVDPTADFSTILAFQFYDSDVVNYDQSILFGAASATSRAELLASGVRMRITYLDGQTGRARIRIYNAGVVVHDEPIDFDTDISQAIISCTFNANGSYLIVFSQQGRAYVGSGSITGSWDHPGVYAACLTGLNGVVSGTDECWTSADRFSILGTRGGQPGIAGEVRRHNLLLEGARVTCVSHADDSYSGRQTTEADGLYHFAGLDPGLQYDLMATYTQGSGAYTSLCRAGVRPIVIPP